MGVIASVQQYDLNIPVGGSQAIDVAGDRVQFLSATDPFAVIEVRPNFAQGNITLKPGQGMRFSEQVQRWVVFNKGTVALTGMLIIGTGDFFDQRISGTVDVIDGGKARTLGGIAMMGYAMRPAVAAQNSRVQLWNPAGSGKRLCVEAVTTVSGNAAENVNFIGSTVALAATIQYGVSKLLGGTASVVAINTDSVVGIAPTVGILHSMTMAAASSQSFKFTEPIIVMPGNGLTGWSTVVNADLGMTYEWYEESV